MNWDRVRSENAIARYGSERLERAHWNGRTAHSVVRRSRNAGNFRLQSETPCGTCGVAITAGSAAKMNVIGQVVHPKGCPKKAK